MTENEIARVVFDVCLKLHRDYGPGLFESVYKEILSYELAKSGLYVEQQKPVPVIHDMLKMEVGSWKLDFGPV